MEPGGAPDANRWRFEIHRFSPTPALAALTLTACGQIDDDREGEAAPPVSWHADIAPIIEAHCDGCHSGGCHSGDETVAPFEFGRYGPGIGSC